MDTAVMGLYLWLFSAYNDEQFTQFQIEEWVRKMQADGKKWLKKGVW